ncbi:hypothetical protein CPB86DRAFT_554508 [Serendipita vermifera]|nr:hypothetical protein CPB86DRAFT_554508 [Serendipita vermifera]
MTTLGMACSTLFTEFWILFTVGHHLFDHMGCSTIRIWQTNHAFSGLEIFFHTTYIHFNEDSSKFNEARSVF